MSKSANDIVNFATATAETESYRPDAEKIVSGSPDQKVQNLYTDETGKFFTGIWSGKVGAHKVSYTEEEFCQLLSGKVRLTSADGAEQVFNKGDNFVIPAGFSGIWETLEDASKIYVVYEKA